MNFCKNLIGAILLLFLGACSTSKEVVYFQDLRPGESELALTDPVEIKIQPKDKLSILVNSQDLRLTNLFNLPIVSQQIGMEGSSGSNRGVSGYTVDSKGNIDFPVLGEIHIAGMTREEVAAYIKKELQSHDLIKDPVVTVEYMNLSVAVMGEVNNPGRFSIDKDNLTILYWCCVKKKENNGFMESIFALPSIFTLRLLIICNRMMWYMWSLMLPKPVSLP